LWETTNAYTLSRLPQYLQHSFPAVLSHRSGLDVSLVNWIRDCICEGLGISSIRRILRINHRRFYDIQRLKYYDLCVKIVLKQTTIDQVLISRVPNFGEFQDKTGFCGSVPSESYLRKIYEKHHQCVRQYMDNWTASMSSDIIKIDHSFKIAKLVVLPDGTKLFVGLWTCMNEICQKIYSTPSCPFGQSGICV
jgi:hypothetical protein